LKTFQWLTIMFSRALGTAFGDWPADATGPGYTGAVIVLSELLAPGRGDLPRDRRIPQLLLWTAFILARPLRAVVGDFLDKSLSAGGLALSRHSASIALPTCMPIAILLFRQRAARAIH